MRKIRLMSMAAFSILWGCGRAPQDSPDPWKDARDFVTASLRDPDSAKFGPFTHGKGSSVCGWVNSKNAFGGYTGMEPFVYTPGAPQPLIIYEFQGPVGDWDQRGELAESFAGRGCTIGPDQERALQAIRLIRESDRRLLGH